MRIVVVASIIAACIAGAAVAQDAPPQTDPAPQEEARPPEPVRLTWARQANGGHFARYYPSRAVNAGASGAAVICCDILADGRLDCEVGFEWPRDFGFGEATLRVAREFRLSEESAAQAAGGRLRRMIVWQMGARTPALEDALTRIREGTQNVCGPAIDWSARAPNDIVVTTSEQQ